MNEDMLHEHEIDCDYKLGMRELLDEVTQQTIAEEKNEEHLYYTSI